MTPTANTLIRIDDSDPVTAAKAREYEKLLDQVNDSNAVLRDFREDYFLFGVEDTPMNRLVTWLVGKDLYAAEKAILLQEARRLQAENDQRDIDFQREQAHKAKMEKIAYADAHAKAVARDEERKLKAEADKKENDRIERFRTVGTWTVEWTHDGKKVVGTVDLNMNLKGHRQTRLASIRDHDSGKVLPDSSGRYARSMEFLRSYKAWNHFVQPWLEGVLKFKDIDHDNIHKIAYLQDGDFIPIPAPKVKKTKKTVDAVKAKSETDEDILNKTIDEPYRDEVVKMLARRKPVRNNTVKSLNKDQLDLMQPLSV